MRFRDIISVKSMGMIKGAKNIEANSKLNGEEVSFDYYERAYISNLRLR